MTLSPVKNAKMAKIGNKSAPAATARAPGSWKIDPASPLVVARRLVLAARIGKSPIVTKMAATD